jgi:hypothetical protein
MRFYGGGWTVPGPATSLFVMIRPVNLALTVLLLAFAPGLQAAKPPVLMLLEHIADGKAVQTKIELKSGVVESKDKGKPRDKWIVRAGEAIKSETRPGERAVNFYKTTGGANTLLFIVKARYYRDPGRAEPDRAERQRPAQRRGLHGRARTRLHHRRHADRCVGGAVVTSTGFRVQSSGLEPTSQSRNLVL